MEGDQPGVTPAAPAGTDPSGSSAQPPAPTGSEADTNPGDGQEQSVPFTRFQEVNDKAKADAARAEKAEQELEELRQQQTPSSEEDEDIDPNVESLVTKIIEKKGYVKKEDVDTQIQQVEGQRQYKEDVASLTSEYAKSGVPFVEKDVREYAKEHGINVTNKSSLDAVYKDMNFDKIVEAAKNSAITDFKESRGTQGEKPGGSGGKPEEQQQEVRGVKNRIHAAAQKLRTA